MAFVDARWFRVFAVVFTAFIFYLSWIVNLDKDLDIFIEASRLVFRGESPYENWLGTAGLKYYYSPFFAMILYPLKDTPQLFYAFVWTLLNFYLVFRVFALLVELLAIRGIDVLRQRLFILFCLACSVRFLLDNLSLGQMTVMLLWATLETLRLWMAGKWLLAGALLALVINIKLLPVAVFCYFFYKGSWKVCLATAGFSILLLWIPSFVWGSAFNQQLHGDWLNTLTGTSVNSIVEDDNRPGLSSLIPSLVTETPVKFGLQRNFMELGPGAVQIVTNIGRLLFVLFGVALISGPLKKPGSTARAFYDMSVICLLTPLVYPHQGKYALLYTLPAYAVCIWFLLQTEKPWRVTGYRPVFILVAISFILVTLTTDGVITRTGSDFAEYYHLLSYGTFALLAALWKMKPGLKE